MRIKVKVNTKAKENKIKKISKDEYIIKTTQIPEKGKANEKILKMMAKELKIAKSNLIITSGEKSNYKVIEIDN